MSDIAELLERFRRGGEVVAVAMTGASGPQVDFVPAAGTWTARQIVRHLADMEMLAAVRFRRVIAEDNPTLMACDQDAWASRLYPEKPKTAEALEMFRRLRQANYALLAQQPPEAFARQGMHSERGAVTLLEMVTHLAEHAENHARQIHDIRRQYKESRAGS